MNPKVSVIIPAYNCEKYLRDSIESILNQTFTDFELLLINDGSTDGSLDIINSCSDPRIRVLINQTNTGLASVRNKGMAEAHGEYIAWLDADDMSLPQRLEKQVRVLDDNPGIGLCGTHASVIGSGSDMEWRYPAGPENIYSDLLFYDPLITSSVMVRKRILAENNLWFNADYLTAEDYDLWERVTRRCLAVNIPEILTIYRLHGTQTSSLKQDSYKEDMDWSIQIRRINLLGIDPDDRERNIHRIVASMKLPEDKNVFMEAEKWLVKLLRSNNISNIYPENTFRCILGARWLQLLFQSELSRNRKLCKFIISPFHDWKFKFRFLMKRFKDGFKFFH